MYLFNGIFTHENVDCEKVLTTDFVVKKIDNTSITDILFSDKQSTNDIYEIANNGSIFVC